MALSMWRRAPVEVAGEEVAAGQTGADLALFQPVPVASGRLEGVAEGLACLVHEPGLEQHLGVVEPCTVAR